MSNHITNMNSRILDIANSDIGKRHNIVTSLDDIPEIPIDNFSDLEHAILTGQAIIRKFPAVISQSAFDIVATSGEKTRLALASSLVLIIPITGLLLSLIFSWWFLVLLAFSFVGIKVTKFIYLKTIFRRASESEPAFCLLFCVFAITIELPEFGLIMRNQEPSIEELIKENQELSEQMSGPIGTWGEAKANK